MKLPDVLFGVDSDVLSQMEMIGRMQNSRQIPGHIVWQKPIRSVDMGGAVDLVQIGVTEDGLPIPEGAVKMHEHAEGDPLGPVFPDGTKKLVHAHDAQFSFNLGGVPGKWVNNAS